MDDLALAAMLRFDKCTFDYDNTGLAIYQSLANGSWPQRVILRRFNLRNSPTFPGGGDTLVVGKQTRLNVDRVYFETGFGRTGSGAAWPPLGSYRWKLSDSIVDGSWREGTRAMTKVGNGVNPGNDVVFPKPSADNIWGVGGRVARIRYGVPASGDFVPLGTAGDHYVPSGYR